jgi:hypothetical protein
MKSKRAFAIVLSIAILAGISATGGWWRCGWGGCTWVTPNEYPGCRGC